MTARVHDVSLLLALRAECRALAREHPAQREAEEHERLAEWFAGEEPDSPDNTGESDSDEPLSGSERSTERPASRGH